MTLRLCFYNDPLVCERLNRHLNLVQYSTSTALNLYIAQGDEADLAKKIATLKWHEKEMEVHVHVYAFVIVFAYK